MNKITTFIFCLVMLNVSCEKGHLNEEDEWRLGWRMIYNYSNERYEIAELQFDTLFAANAMPNLKFIEYGIKVKSQLQRTDELKRIIESQPDEVIMELCSKDWKEDFLNCVDKSSRLAKDTSLQKELILMYVNDQAVRGILMNDLIAKYQIDSNQVTTDLPSVVDASNTLRLKEIISEHGFPTGDLIGRDAMSGVFLIIQHSNELAWQKVNLPFIESAVSNGYLDGQEYAMLYDRIQENSDLKQRYGTQLDRVDDTTYRLYDVENIKELDRRRKEIGLFPFSMYEKIYKEEYGIEIVE